VKARAGLSDGINVAVASPNSKQVLGTDVRIIKDATGRLFGPELYAAAQKPEGQITEVSYMRPRTGSDNRRTADNIAKLPELLGTRSSAKPSDEK
jgi:hypothetical protein